MGAVIFGVAGIYSFALGLVAFWISRRFQSRLRFLPAAPLIFIVIKIDVSLCRGIGLQDTARDFHHRLLAMSIVSLFGLAMAFVVHRLVQEANRRSSLWEKKG